LRDWRERPRGSRGKADIGNGTSMGTVIAWVTRGSGPAGRSDHGTPWCVQGPPVRATPDERRCYRPPVN
jgi:hypothetical protein